VAQDSSRWADLARLAIGDSASARIRVDAALIAATAQLTGDDNPIHLDAAAARRIGQSRPLAHGVIVLGVISKVIGTELPGRGSIWFGNDVEFIAPFYEGDELTITLTVAHISTATRVVVLDVAGRNARDAAVVRGRVSVRVPELEREERPSMNVDDRVTIVTGGSRGIGRAIAEGLASPSAKLVIAYRDDRAAADAAVAALTERGAEVSAVAADLATADGARRVVDAATGTFGRVDAVVHCATPPVTRQPFLDTPPELFRSMFETYVVALAELARLVAPAMKERRHGRIVAILSSAVAEVPPRLSAYITTKHALLGLCRSLAVELGPSNVTVNAVSPSLVVGRHADDLGAAAREAIARRTPLRRLADGADVASVVRFLLSDEASFVSGVNLPVTGGLSI
jgi:3-oxoacyl-[acyl-carrier protein] reductase